MDTSKKILVPIDFRPESMDALELAAIYAKELNASVVLLNVIEDTSFFRRVFGQQAEMQLISARENLQKELSELARKHLGEHIDFDVMVSKGKVYSQIVEVSELINAELVVMGTQGQPKRIKRLMGSNAQRVVTTSVVPVITVREGQKICPVQKIMLPLDLKKETKEKVSTAIALARIFNCEIALMTVFSDSLNEEDTIRLKNNISQVELFISKKGLKVTADRIHKSKERSRAEEILKYAEDSKSDLIMIMTQQETEFTPHFLGSIAQSIMFSSGIPVMSIRPKVTQFAYNDLP